jgi:hypothetical protein
MANRFPLIFNSGAGQIQELAASDNLDLTSSNLVNAGILFTSSGSATAPSLQIGSGTTYNPGLYSPGADQLAISTNGVTRLLVDSVGGVSTAGQFGAGTSSPSNLYRATINGNGSSVVGGLSLRNNGTETLTIGNVTAANDVDSEIWNPRNGYLRFATNNTEQMRLTAGGLLGLGTSSPAQALHVSQSGGNNFAGIRTQNSNSGTGIAGLEFSSDATYAKAAVGLIRNDANGVGSLVFYNASSTGAANWSTADERLRITSAGNVGIGTTGPSSTLDINGDCTVANTKAYQLKDSGGTGRYSMFMSGSMSPSAGNDLYIGNTLANSLVLYTNNTPRATIDSSGRLLVGTTSARSNFYNSSNSARFQIEGSGSNDNYALSIVSNYAGGTSGAQVILAKSGGSNVGDNTLVSDGNTIGQVNFQGADGTDFVEAASISAVVDGTPGANVMPGRLVFSTNSGTANTSPTERMRIKADGTVATAGGFGIGNIANAVPNSFYIASSAIASGAGNSTLKYSTSSGVVTYDASSRLVKEQIVDCPYGIDTVKLLQPRKYFRTDDQREEVGFVADELVHILPEFVPIGPKSVITKNEEDTQNIPLGVNYEKLTAVLTKALQEAIARIETLESKVAALEAS